MWAAQQGPFSKKNKKQKTRAREMAQWMLGLAVLVH